MVRDEIGGALASGAPGLSVRGGKVVARLLCAFLSTPYILRDFRIRKKCFAQTPE